LQTWTAQSAASNSVVVDTTPPTVPTPTVTAGYRTTLSVPVTLGSVTDAGSGVNAGSIFVQRDQAALTNGACEVFPNAFDTTVTLASGKNTSVSSGFCYQ
jgi:hypothetical protein